MGEQQGELQQGQEVPQRDKQQGELQRDLPGLGLQRQGRLQAQQKQGELQGHQGQGLQLGDRLLRKGQASLLLWLTLARPTVLRPSGAERLWRSASSTKISTTTATTRSAPRNAGAQPAEGKRIPTVVSTWATGSATSLPPLARLSAKRMRHSAFAPQNASSLKATLTAAPPPVLPSVQTQGGGSAALEVFQSVAVCQVAVLSATTASMASDSMLMRMACSNPNNYQHLVI